MDKIKYIYLTSRDYTTGVYQTQIIDWLNLYKEHGIDFELWHAFRQTFSISKSILKHRTKQKQLIKNAFNGQSRFIYQTPYRRLKWINNYLLLFYLIRYGKNCDRLVIFSRDNIGQEIAFLKKLYGKKIVYYLDLRSALAEEHLLSLKKQKMFSLKHYRSLAYTLYCEFKKQKEADKIFVVSNTLKNYFVDNYNADISKFVLYPCLSSSKKFYNDPELRTIMRKELRVKDEENLYVYSGGLQFSWHIPDTFVKLFIEIAKKDAKAKLLIMSPNIPNEIRKNIDNDVLLGDRVILREAIPNEEVVKYLNAADFGFLLRENNPVNNVASPSKYAEYILCGLPTIISEGVFDYANFCNENHCGYVITDRILDNMTEFEPLKKTDFNREHIAKIGLDKLSKESAVKRILNAIVSI